MTAEALEELRAALNPEHPFSEAYSIFEKHFYGMDHVSLAEAMKEVALRVKESNGRNATPAHADELYDPHFFDWIREGSRRSAAAIVPLLVELLHPHSVVDVGCGDGTWLAAFIECGVSGVQGIDGPCPRSSGI